MIDVADASYLQFFGDDFLRLLLLRYVFCDVVLHLHRSFKVSHILSSVNNIVQIFFQCNNKLVEFLNIYEKGTCLHISMKWFCLKVGLANTEYLWLGIGHTNICYSISLCSSIILSRKTEIMKHFLCNVYIRILVSATRKAIFCCYRVAISAHDANPLFLMGTCWTTQPCNIWC